MANTFTTPNMTLVLPVVQGEVGPAWAQELNTAIGTGIDSHDHSTGKGVKVPTAGLNINADLPYNTHKATGLAGASFTAVTQPSSGTFDRGLYVTGADLYYQDGSGNNVRLTQSGAIIPNGTGAANGFYGEYASVVAHAAYYSSTGSYQFYRNSGETVRANLTVGSIQSVSATTNNFYLGLTGGDSGNTATSVKGGWQFVSSTGSLLMKADTASSGSYSTKVQLVPISPSAGVDEYAMSLNDTTQNFGFSTTVTAASAALIGVHAVRVKYGLGGTVPAGVGAYTQYHESSENKSIGQILAYYAVKSTSTNGASVMCISPAFNGGNLSVAGAPVGISVGRFSSTADATSLAAGLLGVPVSGQGITAYANVVPSADASYDLGISGTNRWRSAYFSANVNAGGNLSVGGVVNLHGAEVHRSAGRNSHRRGRSRSGAGHGDHHAGRGCGGQRGGNRGGHDSRQSARHAHLEAGGGRQGRSARAKHRVERHSALGGRKDRLRGGGRDAHLHVAGKHNHCASHVRSAKETRHYRAPFRSGR